MGVANSRGSAAEAMAAAYVELMGWEVMGRNLRLGGVEVDLVVCDGTAHIVVEVKCRTRSDYGGAALTIDGVKRRRLLRAAQALARGDSVPVRIDVMAIDCDLQGAQVRHYRNAVTE
jgi:putative endonuclease